MTNLLSGLKLGKEIGSGAFGTVYLGQDEAHGTVAVKKLTRDTGWPDVVWDAWKAAFLSEAQNLSKATHEHVVQVHYIVTAEDGETVYICMAYCRGGSLQTAFEKGPLPLPQVRKAGTDVLLGLSALHARGMLHRDIKPANILLNARNALIGDLGWSPTISSSGMLPMPATTITSLTRFGTAKERASALTSGRSEPRYTDCSTGSAGMQKVPTRRI